MSKVKLTTTDERDIYVDNTKVSTTEQTHYEDVIHTVSFGLFGRGAETTVHTDSGTLTVKGTVESVNAELNKK